MSEPAKTIIYQSFRTTNVASWIKQCMKSVKGWAELKGYDYRFYDDVLFTYAPEWYRDRVEDNVLLVSDLARLEIGKELLVEGYERVIWMDADLLIFHPEMFDIDIKEQYAFCYETWLDLNDKNELFAQCRVNNAVSVFYEGNSFLEFYIQACKDIVKKKKNIGPWYVGTVFLTMLRNFYPFELLTNVGMIGPFLIRAILEDRKPARQLFQQTQNYSVYAGNLCGSSSENGYKGLKFSRSDYDRLVDKLSSTKGDVINSFSN